ncbi:hypothetical protein ACQKMD_06005 [Viridibacillus sp. NPDC096237]|uniref:hypothetical protein n=1 Tax=Viridibacillus sp. NPDC096237 TaxID=3390721 RepID=UPI003D01268F
MRKGNRIISFDDLAEVTINELQSLHTIHGNSGTLTLKLVDGKEFTLVLEENTSLKQLEAIFYQKPVKRICGRGSVLIIHNVIKVSLGNLI